LTSSGLRGTRKRHAALVRGRTPSVGSGTTMRKFSSTRSSSSSSWPTGWADTRPRRSPLRSRCTRRDAVYATRDLSTASRRRSDVQAVSCSQVLEHAIQTRGHVYTARPSRRSAAWARPHRCYDRGAPQAARLHRPRRRQPIYLTRQGQCHQLTEDIAHERAGPARQDRRESSRAPPTSRFKNADPAVGSTPRRGRHLDFTSCPATVFLVLLPTDSTPYSRGGPAALPRQARSNQVPLRPHRAGQPRRRHEQTSRGHRPGR